MATMNSDIYNSLSKEYREAFDKAIKAEFTEENHSQALARCKRGEQSGNSIYHGIRSGRFVSSKPNIQEIPKDEPKYKECPKCKGEGTLDRCMGDCYEGANRICNGEDEGHCMDRVLICQKCNGEGEIEMEVLSREGVKGILDRYRYSTIAHNDDFKSLVVRMVESYKMYKTHLIMAMVEKYYIKGTSKIDYSQGDGKYQYDNIDKRLKELMSKGVLEHWTKGEVLKLKSRESKLKDTFISTLNDLGSKLDDSGVRKELKGAELTRFVSHVIQNLYLFAPPFDVDIIKNIIMHTLMKADYENKGIGKGSLIGSVAYIFRANHDRMSANSKVRGVMNTLINEGYIEYERYRPLKLKDAPFAEGGIVVRKDAGDAVRGHEHILTPQAMAQASIVQAQAMVQSCPDCMGEGKVKCKYNGKECSDLECPDDSNTNCYVTCSTCGGKGTYLVAIPDWKSRPFDVAWVDEAYSIDKSVFDSLIASKKRRTKKKYEVSNEEVHVKRGKRQRVKYIINKGDLT